MKKNLITKIALGVAIAALLFSIVTMVRSFIIGAGVLMSCILVVGTSIIVAICAIMLYVLRNYDYGDDESGDDESGEDEDGEDEDEEESEDEDDGPDYSESKKKTVTARSESRNRKKDKDKTIDQDKEKEIEDEVDKLIADLEEKSSYDLHNFE